MLNWTKKKLMFGSSHVAKQGNYTLFLQKMEKNEYRLLIFERGKSLEDKITHIFRATTISKAKEAVEEFFSNL